MAAAAPSFMGMRSTHRIPLLCVPPPCWKRSQRCTRRSPSPLPPAATAALCRPFAPASSFPIHAVILRTAVTAVLALLSGSVAPAPSLVSVPFPRPSSSSARSALSTPSAGTSRVSTAPSVAIASSVAAASSPRSHMLALVPLPPPPRPRPPPPFPFRNRMHISFPIAKCSFVICPLHSSHSFFSQPARLRARTARTTSTTRAAACGLTPAPAATARSVCSPTSP